MALLFRLLACLFFATAALAASCSSITTAKIWWNVVYASDGTSSKYISVNGTWPPPKLSFNRCTLLVLNVTNSLDDAPITLHFHGILQKNGQTIMDGAQGLSQSGIPKGKWFKYTVLLDTEGTHWVHSHSPGQYPQGLRTPLYVKPLTTERTSANGLGYYSGGEAAITLSDWWPNFKAAEDRSLATDNTTCGVPGANYGVEYPPLKVTINDLYGYQPSVLSDAQKKAARTIDVTCRSPKRIRFVNMASHSRFYIMFSDERQFTINELDGVVYKPKATRLLELSSGQRASITVDGYSDTNQKCDNAYIVALADPKVSHGTKNCPMTPSSSNFGIQYTHAYLRVNGVPIDGPQPGPGIEPVLEPGVDFRSDLARVYFDKTKTNDQGFPNSLTPPNSAMHNRLNLPYKTLWSNPDFGQDYGLTSSSGRNKPTILGIQGAEELEMEPFEEIPAWIPQNTTTADDRPTHMHYITLGALSDRDKVGYAAMSQDTSRNPLAQWKSPDEPSGPDSQEILPTVFRVLRDSVDNSELNDVNYYQNDPGTQTGRTILLKDDQVHWFILRSTIGDHPMHMHGHHFQVLAKLPSRWYDEKYSLLFEHVTNRDIRTVGKPNPDNPPRRDTLMIEKDMTYVIAINADNPGVWAFHCHNDIHARSGMFSQIIERPVDLRATLGSWDYYTSGSKTQLRWWYSSAATVFSWRSRTTLAGWMVTAFNNAIVQYGWSTSKYYGYNSGKPSQWGLAASVRRWLPRGRSRS